MKKNSEITDLNINVFLKEFMKNANNYQPQTIRVRS